jgi:hypothetical protein
MDNLSVVEKLQEIESQLKLTLRWIKTDFDNNDITVTIGKTYFDSIAETLRKVEVLRINLFNEHVQEAK